MIKRKILATFLAICISAQVTTGAMAEEAIPVTGTENQQNDEQASNEGKQDAPEQKSETEKKDTSPKGYGTIAVDNYCKTLAKGFLGKKYRAVIDGISCDCSGYVRAALNRMNSEKDNVSTPIRKYVVKAQNTAAWVNGSSVIYYGGIRMADTNQIVWNAKKKVGKVGKTTLAHNKVSTLNLGDVMVYGKGKSTTHIAAFYGKFKNTTAVRNYLVKLGVFKKNQLKKTADGKYLYKGRTVIRSYTNSKYWRIHSTCSGIMIDNDIKGTSGYTSSFGKWKWTFETGLKTENSAK